MPEGPEIKRAADRLAKALVNRPAIELFFAFEHLKIYESQLEGQPVISVRPRGKAQLIRFGNDLSIYSHNQLYGKWEVKRAYNYPDTRRQLRLAIHTETKSALLYSASEIDVLDDDDIAKHPFLTGLGPDVLNDNITPAELRDRLQSKRFCRRRLGTLLLDQQFVCGLGNYLRSEALFVAGIHPLQRALDCSADRLHRLATAAIALPDRSYRHGGITNDLDRAAALKAEGYRRRAYRHHVFGRVGQPCFTCGDTIRKDRTGGRRYYFCPTCQPDPRE